MSDFQNGELSPEESEAFRLLAESRNPVVTDEDRIVRALRKRGLLREPKSRFALYAKGLAIAASVIAAFLLGTQFGRTEQPVVQPVAEPRPAARTSAAEVLLTEASLDLGEDVIVTALNCDDPEFLYDPQCFSVKTVGW
jgi:hypothetical protein